MRDAILGTRSAVLSTDIVRVVDIGMTLLATLRATPRETAVVADVGIALYAAEGRERRRDVVGLALAVTSAGGLVTEERLVPTSRRGYLRPRSAGGLAVGRGPDVGADVVPRQDRRCRRRMGECG